MNAKKIILHLLIRIGILVLLIGSFFLLWYLTVDRHSHCHGDDHKHFDTGLGFFIIELMAIQAFCVGMLIEMIYLFVKKKQNLAFANLGFLIISVCIAFALCI
ncbi:hypothetical protein B0A67_08765 [Flavobacterium aquidurense]|jgi:hypothetical protein|nr:hypothetical protein B0A67_08765 [Flavobacterium aquidurense]SHG47247.1 hypothetical protein SAMN05444481_104325 [Flavobacterium frigidimaris]